MRLLLNIFLGLIEGILRNFPTQLGVKLRYWYYRRRLGTCGKNVRIGIGVVIGSPRCVHLGNNVQIDHYVVILAGKPRVNRQVHRHPVRQFNYGEGELHIGENVHVAPYCLLQAHGGMCISKNAGIASGAKLYSFTHHYRNLEDSTDLKAYHFSSRAPHDEQYLLCSPVVLGESTAVGLNSVVLPGTYIPDRTWIGALAHIQGTRVRKESIYGVRSADRLYLRNQESGR